MKKVLFIDNMGPKGHNVFNQIQIKALKKAGAQVDVVLGGQFKGYFEEAICNRVYYVEPYDNNRIGGHFKFRVDIFKQWRSIRKLINYSDYDLIILSHFDPYLLPIILRTDIPIYVFVHSPSALSHNWITSYACRISSVRKFVVFNLEMKQALKKIGINNSCVIPHGFESKFKTDKSCYEIVDSRSRFIFCPSAWSTDIGKLRSLLEDIEVKNYCIAHKLFFVIKTKEPIEISNENVIVLPRFIQKNQYESLMKNSECVLICYGTEFKDKVSGVFFECMNNNIKCLYYNNPSLNQYRKFLNFDANFGTASEFIAKFAELQNQASEALYKNLSELDPVVYWRRVLSNKI